MGAMENTDLFDWRAEKATFEYVKKLEKLYRDLQKIERELLLLLKERRKQVQAGFDTLVMREDAANMLGLSTRQLDRLTASGKITGYETIYGMRFRMGDIVAFGQMRGELRQVLTLKHYNPWSKEMSDLDRLLGQIMDVDLSHSPMALKKDPVISD